MLSTIGSKRERTYVSNKLFLLLQGHWYNVKVRGGIHVDISRRDDLLDRPVSKCYLAFCLISVKSCAHLDSNTQCLGGCPSAASLRKQ